MRVRITKKIPDSCGIDADSLLVGRVYNVDAALASALLLEGCAEAYDLLTASEKRESTAHNDTTLWQAANRSRPDRDDKPRGK